MIGVDLESAQLPDLGSAGVVPGAAGQQARTLQLEPEHQPADPVEPDLGGQHAVARPVERKHEVVGVAAGAVSTTAAGALALATGDARPPGDADVDQADRLLGGAAVGPGDARRRHADVGAEALAHALRHGAGYRLGDGTVLDQELFGHAEQRLLGAVRIGDHAAQEPGRAARHVRDAVGDEAARARFGDGDRGAALGEQPPRNRRHRLVVLAVDEVAEALADRLDDVVDAGVGLGDRVATGDHAQEVVGERRAKREIGAVLARDVAQLALERRLADPEGAQDAGAHPHDLAGGLEPALDARQHLLVHHLRDLAGHAGHAEHQTTRLFDHEARRGAGGIREHLGVFGKECLLAVGVTHLAADALEEGADRLEGAFIEPQRATEGLADHFGRDVVARGTEPARDQQHVASRHAVQKGLAHVVAIVAKRRLMVALDVEVEQPLGEQRFVGVDDLAAKDLVADGEDLGLHAGSTSRASRNFTTTTA